MRVIDSDNRDVMVETTNVTALHPEPPAPQRVERFADVSLADWNDWRWQHANRIRTADELGRLIALTDDERLACEEVSASYPLGVTPYYASLMDPNDPSCGIRRQCVPTTAELAVRMDELVDPLAEESHMPVRGLTHRYPDRVLLYTTHTCAVYCRFCNRRRKVGNPASALSRADLARAIDYIRRHPKVRDVVISGGDPLTLSDARLDELVGSLRDIEHVEIVRLATRSPVTLPQRVTPELGRVLAKHHPVFVNTHFNHLKECTDEAACALRVLADAGMVLGNQMVLLKGVNDNPEMVRRMNQWLLRHRCRPYYIFQCDPAQGVSHFRTPVAAGLRIVASLRGWTSGLAVPHYVVDLPGGGGKVALEPNYLISRRGKTMTFNNYAGEIYSYEDG